MPIACPHSRACSSSIEITSPTPVTLCAVVRGVQLTGGGVLGAHEHDDLERPVRREPLGEHGHRIGGGVFERVDRLAVLDVLGFIEAAHAALHSSRSRAHAGQRSTRPLETSFTRTQPSPAAHARDSSPEGIV
jgi:hypothetical protein